MQKDLSCLPTPGCPSEMSPGEVLSYSSPQALFHASLFFPPLSPFFSHLSPRLLRFSPTSCSPTPSPFAKAPQTWWYQPVLKGRPDWESVCQRAPKGVTERDHCAQYFPVFPDLPSSQLFPGDPFSALSPSLPSHCCSWLLCHSHFSAT